MKLFSTSQVRELDRYTIENEPISSVDLMERAARALATRFTCYFPKTFPVLVVAGPGNNGGDGLALARMLLAKGYNVSTVLLHSGKLSDDAAANLNRLKLVNNESVVEMQECFHPPVISSETIVVDALFGSGLSRPLNGVYARAVDWINGTGCRVVSVDIPSGLDGDCFIDEGHPVVKATFTYALQFSKRTFFFADSALFIGKYSVLDIGIHPRAIENIHSDFMLTTEDIVRPFIKARSRFSHKGVFGHALLVAGCKGMAGASVLAGKAALRAGAGLVTVHGPKCNRTIVQTTVPEAIFSTDTDSEIITDVPNPEKYDVLGIGPGIGTNAETEMFLHNFIQRLKKVSVFDADALNLIAKNKDWLNDLPPLSVLTPHPREFERLFGASRSVTDRIELARQSAAKYNVVIVLKGAHTAVVLPEGKVYINTTGNSGLSSAGTGDVLTGIITGLLAQGYASAEAAIAGVYLHGLAADLALERESEESLIATDVISYLGEAFHIVSSRKKQSGETQV